MIRRLDAGTRKCTPTPEALRMSPPRIRHVQTRLQEAGFAPGPIDGIFGPRTVVALRRYQARHGLPTCDSLLDV
jgi:peptidoglycan hydrolase-like protein with peptidoglycan-binding domain